MSRRLLQCSAVEDGSLGGRVTQCAFTWAGEGECYLICTRRRYAERDREEKNGYGLALRILTQQLQGYASQSRNTSSTRVLS